MSQITKMARKESGGQTGECSTKCKAQMGRISQIAYFTTYWYILQKIIGWIFRITLTAPIRI